MSEESRFWRPDIPDPPAMERNKKQGTVHGRSSRSRGLRSSLIDCANEVMTIKSGLILPTINIRYRKDLGRDVCICQPSAIILTISWRSSGALNDWDLLCCSGKWWWKKVELSRDASAFLPSIDEQEWWSSPVISFEMRQWNTGIMPIKKLQTAKTAWMTRGSKKMTTSDVVKMMTPDEKEASNNNWVSRKYGSLHYSGLLYIQFRLSLHWLWSTLGDRHSFV